MSFRKTPADYHALANQRGFIWLGPEVSNVDTKTTWQCRCRRTYQSTYYDVSRGHSCPMCGRAKSANTRRTITPDALHELAKTRDFEWMGQEVQTKKHKTRWRCPYGHEWEAHYTNISMGKGCPQCATDGRADKRRLKPHDYCKLAHKRAFIWLGPIADSTKVKTGWQCNKGHVWQASYLSVSRGSGQLCPICNDMVNGAAVSLPQRKLHAILGGELNLRVGRYVIDVALAPNIAVEYDSWYWHQDKEAHDSERTLFLVSSGWRVLRIKSREMIPTKKQLHLALNRLLAGETHIEIILNDWQGR